MPARRSIYQDKAAGPGLGKVDALIASREAHEELLLESIAQEQLAKAAGPPRPTLVDRVRRLLRRG